MKDNQVLNIFLVSPGLGISKALYDQYCNEHYIGIDGMPLVDSLLASMNLSNRRSIMFRECKDGWYVANAFIMDSEIGDMNTVKNGKYKDLFPERQSECYKETACKFARGHFGDAGNVIDVTLDSIRKHVESLDTLIGFNIVMTLEGGFGSGFGSLLVKK